MSYIRDYGIKREKKIISKKHFNTRQNERSLV